MEKTSESKENKIEIKNNKNKNNIKNNSKNNKNIHVVKNTNENNVQNNVQNNAKSNKKNNGKKEINVRNNKNNKNGKNIKKESSMRIIPLGGLEEIGKNMTVIEFEDEAIIVDCGVAFPEDELLGIDLVIPDFTYVEKNIDKIKGIFITHGHEDHIGGIPYLLKKVKLPIYATRLSIELINLKLIEHNLDKNADLNVVEYGEVVRLGKFSVEFISSTHSIPDAAMLAITTKAGTILHTGDFKIDLTPIDGVNVNLQRIGEISRKGLLALLADSTNSEKKGYTMSEKSVGAVMEKFFENCKKRIIVSTFASNVNRVKELIKLALKYNRKVAVSGRSMERVLEVSQNIGYIKLPDNMFVELDEISKIPDENLLIITTGSQGETMSALTRIAKGEHKKIKLQSNDMVIISATPIPGNEVYISKVINVLLKKGIEVIYYSLEHVHVSGHACQEEQKVLMALTRPKYFIPVHGEMRHLLAHKNTAIEMGIPEENIAVLENGSVLEISNKAMRLREKVEAGRTFIDGLSVGDIGSVVLKDRQLLSNDGLVIVVLTINSNGDIVSGPEIISRGFVYVKESEQLLGTLKKVLEEELNKLTNKSWGSIKALIKNKATKYLFKNTKREPMILPIITEA